MVRGDRRQQLRIRLPPAEFGTWLGGVALFALAALVPLKLAMIAYERGT